MCIFFLFFASFLNISFKWHLFRITGILTRKALCWKRKEFLEFNESSVLCIFFFFHFWFFLLFSDVKDSSNCHSHFPLSTSSTFRPKIHATFREMCAGEVYFLSFYWEMIIRRINVKIPVRLNLWINTIALKTEITHKIKK